MFNHIARSILPLCVFPSGAIVQSLEGGTSEYLIGGLYYNDTQPNKNMKTTALGVQL